MLQNKVIKKYAIYVQFVKTKMKKDNNVHMKG